MASELRVDTLKDSSGNNSVGMAYVSGGSAKAWVNFDGTGTNASRDSLNVSGLVDNGTGDYTISYTSSLANSNYSLNGISSLIAQRLGIIWIGNSSYIAAGSSRIGTLYTTNFTGGGAGDDQSFVSVQTMGDLA